MDTIKNITDDIEQLIVPGKAEDMTRYFRIKEYGINDKFLGVKVPDLRKVAKKYYKDIKIHDTEILLTKPVHEYRHTALFILVNKFQKGDDYMKEVVVETYLKNTKYINNWDLVDCSAPYITGPYWYQQKERNKILNLSESESIWEQRIAILSTFYFIRENHYELTCMLCRQHFNNPEKLIHKACGWMLREIGKREIKLLEAFLEKYASAMPAIMLSYAIEKFSSDQRAYYRFLRKK